MALKELSGVFTEAKKWSDTYEALASTDCSLQHLRIYHNTPENLACIALSLQGNTSVRTLEVGVAAAEGSQALAELLKVSQQAAMHHGNQPACQQSVVCYVVAIIRG